MHLLFREIKVVMFPELHSVYRESIQWKVIRVYMFTILRSWEI